DEQPFVLELRGKAPDAELDHTVFVQVTVVSALQRDVYGVASVGLPEGMGL
ncbi:unnamed protein product, partial [marine sediment metagenome]